MSASGAGKEPGMCAHKRGVLAARRGRGAGRRGVASVLAMMFMVLFGSLAVAMAISSKGNLRTAQTHLHVTRALGAAETGLLVAGAFLAEASGRFVVTRGDLGDGFGGRLWAGTTLEGDGEVEVLPPPSGFEEFSEPGGIAEALRNAFAAQQNVVNWIEGVDSVAEIHSIPAWADPDEFASANWVTTPPIAIDMDAATPGARPAAYQITFGPLADGVTVRAFVTGYSSVGVTGSDYHYTRGQSEDEPPRAVRRVLQQDFRIEKRHLHAMIAPSRIMIGKNTMVSGPLGAGYTDVTFNNGDPVILRSDFRGMNDALDAKLDRLHESIVQHDVDGDNRLRVNHPIEGASLPSGDEDFDGDGQPDNAFDDVTGDGFLDEFDVFIRHYDTDGDGRVVLPTALTEGTPAEGQTPEFTDDDDLALLIDSSIPDRNRNGVWGFVDTNGDGRWTDGETMLDVDTGPSASPFADPFADRVLGYRDGVIDRRDRYAKLRGQLLVRVDRSAWEDEHGAYQDKVRGPIVSERGKSPIAFGVGTDEMPDLHADLFTDAQTPLQDAADGEEFWRQVAAQLGIAEGELGDYVEEDADPGTPRYWRADLDPSYVYSRTGMHIYEKVPFNSPAHSDWYYRPRFENMTFTDVQIPRGLNALFVNCTFVGVTWVRSYAENTHENWSLYGRMVWDDGAQRPVLATDPLDKSDFERYFTGVEQDGPPNYDDFLDPPVIDGAVRTGAERNTKLYSNNLRFHGCLFVGSLTSDKPQVYTHLRNKMQFTGGTRFLREHPEDDGMNPEPQDLPEIDKTSLMAPNYSVDIGSFNSPPEQDVRLRGTIIAGVLDMRGNGEIDGTLLLTFRPVHGEPPLSQQGQPVGNPAGFNATFGYFGPEDGDGESLDPESLPLEDGVRVVGWDLDGDGIADLGPDSPPTQQQRDAGATAVPWHGYGRISINWNPSYGMPDGIRLRLTSVAVPGTYTEGKH